MTIKVKDYIARLPKRRQKAIQERADEMADDVEFYRALEHTLSEWESLDDENAFRDLQGKPLTDELNKNKT